MADLESLKSDVESIKIRNHSVELDKAWELSFTRRFSIIVLTYLCMVVFMFIAELPKPFINALIPVVAFLLSTLSLEVLKKWWMKSKSSK